MNKRKKFLIKATTIILIVSILLWVMPGRVKRYFPNYLFFSALTMYEVFPDVLPLSAHNLRYYNYRSYNIKKSGYKATFSARDYEKIKAKQWEIYNTGHAGEYHLYDGKNKLYLDREDMSQRGLDFLDDLLPLEDDDGQYYNLAYLCNDGSYYVYCGVICNDEKQEILEFSYYDYNH